MENKKKKYKHINKKWIKKLYKNKINWNKMFFLLTKILIQNKIETLFLKLNN